MRGGRTQIQTKTRTRLPTRYRFPISKLWVEDVYRATPDMKRAKMKRDGTLGKKRNGCMLLTNAGNTVLKIGEGVTCEGPIILE